MKHESQVAIARQWLDLNRRGVTTMADAVMPMDPRHYTSAQQFERERELIFRQHPQVVCLSTDVASRGDFLTTESGGVPLVVVRGNDGIARTFVNVCRHRGALVAQGCGHGTRSFVCPFHAWTYGLDGSLRSQSRSMDGFANCDPTTLGLIEVPSGERHGLVVARPGGGDPIDLDEYFGELGAELEPFALRGTVPYRRQRRIWRCNWKLILDTFLESYHVFSLHRDSVGPDYPGHIMVSESFGAHQRIPVPRASIVELESQPEHEWSLLAHATVQHFLFPNAMVNFTLDHWILWRFIPTAVDETIAEMTQYQLGELPEPGSAADSAAAVWFDVHDAVTRDEDYPQAEEIHQGLASGLLPRTVIGRNEAALQRFHTVLRGFMADGLTLSGE